MGRSTLRLWWASEHDMPSLARLLALACVLLGHTHQVQKLSRLLKQRDICQ